MPDREKVIKGLMELHGSKETMTIISDAIALLKEQEAVQVVQCEIMHMLFWCCGSCGVAITDGDKFCRNCGRRMKWDADGETPIPS